MWLNALKSLSKEYALLIPLTVLAFEEGPLRHSMLLMQTSPQCIGLLHLEMSWHETEAEKVWKLLNNYSLFSLYVLYNLLAQNFQYLVSHVQTTVCKLVKGYNKFFIHRKKITLSSFLGAQ